MEGVFLKRKDCSKKIVAISTDCFTNTNTRQNTVSVVAFDIFLYSI